MYATLIKGLLAGELRRQGEKEQNRDADTIGKDDAKGTVFIAIADGIDAVDLGTVNKQTFKNMAKALRAAADSIEKAGEEI